ncbi:polysaccharide deacetylase family protein [Paenibacillus pinistramenti]|uniref:polysaccharide deacetylase family protein n=1 Tax=Paenibacillus pinistramenti TaxID=1768003 RepID=UPI003B8303B1
MRSPRQRMPERAYIYEVLLGEFLGLPYRVEYEERIGIEITIAEEAAARYGGRGQAAGGGWAPGGEAVLELADVLLRTPERDWLKSRSLPRLPLDRWDPRTAPPGIFLPAGMGNSGGLPVLYGLPYRDADTGGSYAGHDFAGHYTAGDGLEGRRRSGSAYLERTPHGLWCGIDLFGSSFFMLTRYEEAAEVSIRDRHDRFPASGSAAARDGFLHRPVVNEYAELLWAALQQLWPGLARKRRRFRLQVSHDVDVPFLAMGRSRPSLLKEALAELLFRRSLESAWRKARVAWPRRDRYAADPFNRFDWLMSLSEAAGVQSSFYFITEDTAPGLDGSYTMDDPAIRALLREIHLRGHRIGLHPGYQTYLHPERIFRQFALLRRAADAAGIRQDVWGGRQHYLRWRAPDTWQHWEDAGLDYDSTLSFADQAGFRCGVCCEYPVFNLRTRRQLHLRERPLVVMDQSIIHPDYMALKGDAAFGAIRHYYDQCAAYGGDFTLLWHNSQLVRRSDRKLYRDSLDRYKKDREHRQGGPVDAREPGPHETGSSMIHERREDGDPGGAVLPAALPIGLAGRRKGR